MRLRLVHALVPAALAAPLALAAPAAASVPAAPAATGAPISGSVGSSVAGSVGADPIPSTPEGLRAAAVVLGDTRELQQRLTWAGVYEGAVDGTLGSSTKTSVRRFQGKFGLVVDGVAGPKTWAALRRVTHNGTGIPASCRTSGKVICIDKTQKISRAMSAGRVVKQNDARFGSSALATKVGVHRVTWKSRDHVSRKYNAPMPFALFFYGGQAVHYSPSFASNGYNGYSHGCVNLRSRSGAQWLFDWAPVGTRVVVYWS